LERPSDEKKEPAKKSETQTSLLKDELIILNGIRLAYKEKYPI